MCKGERPIGAAKGKQTNTMASCHTPPPLPGRTRGRKCRQRGVSAVNALRPPDTQSGLAQTLRISRTPRGGSRAGSLYVTPPSPPPPPPGF